MQLMKSPGTVGWRRVGFYSEVWLHAAFLFAVRLYLVNIFLRSGLLKLQSWDTTLTLFEYEYNVPLLASETAAWLGTAGEIVLPALLLIGLASRFSAIGLLLLNLVAAISYPDISAAGSKDHVLWGWMCLVLIIFGPGRFSVDTWIRAWWRTSNSVRTSRSPPEVAMD